MPRKPKQGLSQQDQKQRVQEVASHLSFDTIKVEPWYKDVQDEITQPDQVVVTSRYFWTRWLPILRPPAATLFIRLRMYCYYNRQTGELRDWCFPAHDTLAEELGYRDRKVIGREMKRLEDCGLIQRTTQYRYDPKQGKKVRTTDVYKVKMWDPLVPEDEPKAVFLSAEKIIRGELQVQENIGLSPKSQKGTKVAPPKSQKGTYKAAPKRDSSKKYFEEVPTHTQKREVCVDSPKEKEGRALVASFREEFGHSTARPAKKRELEQAIQLLSEHGQEKAAHVIRFASQQAKTTNFKPRFFGAILDYVPEALEDFESAQRLARRKREAEKQRREEERAAESERQAYLNSPPEKRAEIRLERKAMVVKALEKRDLTESEREDLFQQMLEEELGRASQSA